MKPLRILSLACCALVILPMQSNFAGEGLFSLNRIFSGGDDASCIENCCDDENCVDGNCLLDGCTDSYKSDKLFGFIRPTSAEFSDFISPMSNPVYFEDPRNLSEIHFFYLNQQIPGGAFGGTLNVLAAQIRVSLTENLSLVASKDGFITSSNPLINDGWADVQAGLKYNIIQDADTGNLLSAGFAYMMPVGSNQSLQGSNGDGEFHLYVSGGKRIGDNGHYLTSTGFRLPANAALGSKMWYWSQHVDYKVTKKFYLLTELNWFSWFQGGNNGALPTIEGGDLINLGSNDVAGNNIFTAAFGGKMRVSGLSEVGIAYEIPLSSRNDLLENRLTVDYNLRF
ncbi:MAG: hypothetical protein JKY95_07950 [Planctomycetaceae bacterium]|nr:hypothetical protein [Planctomycetaceae bacterium]